MKPQRSSSDHEIARYVLGLDMPGHAQDLQIRLAHDDAAAACALKWEAYFLGIADALPPAPPPAALLDRIQATLGLEDAPIAAGPTDAPTTQESAAPGGQAASRVPRLSRRRVLAAAGIGVAIVIAALLIWASLRPTPMGTLVQQPLHLESTSN